MKVNKNKKEVAELLGKSYNTIKHWDETKLIEELKKACWIVEDITKEGRNKYYFLRYEEQDFNIDNFVEEEFNVRDGHNFVCYSKVRFKGVEEDMPITRKQICRETNTSESSAKRYDIKLVEKEVIKKDGYYYICRNIETNMEILVDKEAYDSFWFSNRVIKKDIENNFRRYKEGELTESECEYLVEILKESIKGKYYYFKVRKFILDEKNYIYKLIKSN